MSTWLEMIGAREASALAVIAGSEIWSTEEFLRRAAGAADWLDEIGIGDGTPVPALVESSPEVLALLVGCAGSNRPIAPLGPRTEARVLTACLESLDAPVIVAASAHAAIAREIAAACGRRAHVVPAFDSSDRKLDLDPPGDAIAFILHTSGTTGVPKRVVARQHQMGARAARSAELVAMGPSSVFATPSPFHHSAGLGMCAVALGCGAAQMPWAHFSVDEWRRFGAAGMTHAVLVPTMIEMLLEQEALAIESLRSLVYGASPIRAETLARVLDRLGGVRLVQFYGQTEGTPITCLTHEDHLAAAARPELLGMVGRAAPGIELRIDAVGTDGVGEVCARGGHLFAAGADGWLHTGDLGRVDERGYLSLSGRKGDMIIRGGENVYPDEVEAVLAAHPGVREVAVAGVAEPKWGQIVKAWIVPMEAAPSAEELRAFARDRLAGFKVPSEWAMVDALPRNAAGKVLRRELAASG